jgi:hypothetical protein
MFCVSLFCFLLKSLNIITILPALSALFPIRICSSPSFFLSTGVKETKNYSRIEGVMAHTEHEVAEIVRELEYATRTTSKFTDSTRVNGIPQRFLTKYLIVRLNDHLINERVSVQVSC